MYSNYHTHSSYCDGKGTLREYVEYALAHDFCALGFSGHAPVPFENTFAITMERYPEYCREVRALREEYKGRIDIKLGLEIDYVPGLLDDFRPLIEEGGLDYVIGSVHLVNQPDDPASLWFIDGSRQETYDEGLQRVFHGDIRRAVKAFFHQNNAMIVSQKPTIVGHFNKVVMHNRDRYFREDEPWYVDLACETIDLIAETGCICEVNTRGIYKKRHDDFYPSRHLLRIMKDKHIPILVGSDAHMPEDLDRFEGVFEYLNDIGYRDIVTTL